MKLKPLLSQRKYWCLVIVTTLAVTGCASSPGWLSASGPNRTQILESATQESSSIRLIDVSSEVARKVFDSEKRQLFSESLTRQEGAAYAVGPGDVLEVAIWEAPPATLFGTAALDARAGTVGTRSTTLPEQMVSVDGTINVPFAGALPVAGKSPQQIESEITRRLTGKANQPQVLVRVIRNATSNVTVVGEVGQSLRMPLTARGERLLDAVAAAGGVRQPINKVTVQLTRGSLVQSMPLERVIQSPKENILLVPGDVLAVHFQPLSFTVLGATGKNEEINFEAQGISLVQALARAGGLQDARADAQGVFVFRFEKPEALSEDFRTGPVTPDGRVPVVYRLDMKNPASFLVAQNFPVRNKDLLYVSNAPSAELQKFLNLIGSVLGPLAVVNTLAQ